MTEGSRIGRGLQSDEERLPWLEPVPEAVAPRGPSTLKLLAFVLLGLVLLGAAVGSYFWLTQPAATEGHGELIAAPAGPYKVKPSDPGGMAVEGEGDTAFAASEGAEPKGRIDVGAVPEEPVTSGGGGTAGASSGPGAVQLGAFSSEAAAAAAWKALSGRFKYLEGLTHSIVPVKRGEETLYRLHASGPDAANICNRLRIAGETCLDLN